MLNTNQEKQDFLNSVINNRAKDQTQVPASIRLARTRGLQQAIENDMSLDKHVKDQLNQRLSDDFMAQNLKGGKILLNDRSIDHMIHLLKGAQNTDELQSFLGQLNRHLNRRPLIEFNLAWRFIIELTQPMITRVEWPNL